MREESRAAPEAPWQLEDVDSYWERQLPLPPHINKTRDRPAVGRHLARRRQTDWQTDRYTDRGTHVIKKEEAGGQLSQRQEKHRMRIHFNQMTAEAFRQLHRHRHIF